MGVMDKFLKYMAINDEDGDYPEDDYYDEPEEEEKPAFTKKAPAKLTQTEKEEEKPAPRKPASKITPVRQSSSSRRVAANGMEVCVIRPTSFDDAREITSTLLSERTVILNLEGLDMDIAQRIIDFTSGSCFAINGSLQKISHYIFIITPESVDISGDFQDIFSGAFRSPLNSDM